MPSETHVMEYKCPCCDAPLVFSSQEQMLHCDACGNDLEPESVIAFSQAEKGSDGFTWDTQQTQPLSQEEMSAIVSFTCPSCGGQILTDQHTVATFCPYCENPAVIPGRVSDALRPDGVIPFCLGKEDAMAAFANFCKGKPLLPKDFTALHRFENISGIYVPFWLYDCHGSFSGRYRATRVRHWADSRYTYTKTSHYLLTRSAEAGFSGIPMDASSKIDNAIMESIEPFDYSKMTDFNTSYLSGYLADKYDVAAEEGEARIRQRVDQTIQDELSSTFIGYSSVVPTDRSLEVMQGRAKYVLLPVWMLTSLYKGKRYTFAMNGQSGKLSGTLPICMKRSLLWFGGITAAVTAIGTLIGMLL